MNAAEKVRTERRSTSTLLFIGLLFSLVTLIAAYLFINSSYFSVGNLRVEGNKYLATEEVYRIAGVPDRINIFRLNTNEIQSRLLSDLRIAKAEVVRHFPATIVIRLSERRPVAYLASGFGFVELDKEGVVLAAHRNIRQAHVPMITGTRTGNPYVGDTVNINPVKQVVAFLALLDENALNQLSEININGERLTAYTTTSISIRLGNFDRMEEKAKLIANIIQEINQKRINVDYIDLSYASPIIKIKQ
jgi:cell division protein FtsQ